MGLTVNSPGVHEAGHAEGEGYGLCWLSTWPLAEALSAQEVSFHACVAAMLTQFCFPASAPTALHSAAHWPVLSPHLTGGQSQAQQAAAFRVFASVTSALVGRSYSGCRVLGFPRLLQAP